MSRYISGLLTIVEICRNGSLLKKQGEEGGILKSSYSLANLRLLKA